MNEEERIELSPEDGKIESSEEVNETNSPEPVVEQTAPSIINEQPSTETMEVHHHPHIEKKTFKEYLLEGLMIFIAVTLGFFAENLREYLNDERVTTENMQSMIEDLRSDN